MQASMKRHRLWPPLVLTVLTLGLALYAYFSLSAIPDHFQYLWPAPAPTASTGAANATGAADAKAAAQNAGLRDARLKMDDLAEQLDGACEKTTLYAVADGASVVADLDGAAAVTARLEAIDLSAYALRPLLLKSGRLIYSDEFDTGERVIMVDEKLAVALFNYAEPLDRVVLLGSQKYRIVGIVNDGKRVGDHQEYTMYVPYRSMERGALPFSALCIETSPVPGAGGWAAFVNATASLSAQGTCLSLTKETMHAELPLRVLACLFGSFLILFGLRALNAHSKRLYRAYRLRLRESYALPLLPWATARGLLLALGYAACALAFARLFIVFVEPVYTFPEWIPKVLVEPKDISAAFWDVWQKQAVLFELRSPELIRARFFGEVMGWACGGLALAGGLLAARLGDTLRQLLPREFADDAPPADGAPDESGGPDSEALEKQKR